MIKDIQHNENHLDNNCLSILKQDVNRNNAIK